MREHPPFNLLSSKKRDENQKSKANSHCIKIRVCQESTFKAVVVVLEEYRPRIGGATTTSLLMRIDSGRSSATANSHAMLNKNDIDVGTTPMLGAILHIDYIGSLTDLVVTVCFIPSDWLKKKNYFAP